MRILRSELDDRLIIKLDKSIKPGDTNGVMNFGVNNDYPDIIESLILGSVTAKAASDIYSKFLCGYGFSDDVNSQVVSKDVRGKDVTISMLLRQVCKSIAFYNGAYVHVSLTVEGKIPEAQIVPFKYCRFGKPDSRGYSPFIAVYDNWKKDKNSIKPYNKNDVATFNIFNLNQTVLNSQFEKVGGAGNHKGQVYFHFVDNDFMYPLSPFDAAYIDCDTEQQISLYKNNELRNGFTDKTIFYTPPFANEQDKIDFDKQLKQFMGSRGDKCLTVEAEFDNVTGEVKKNGSLIAEKWESNIKDSLFETWEKSTSNNIRKAIRALPSVLIDYDESKLGTTSGEGIIQATNFYNAVTEDVRKSIGEMFKEIFSNSVNEVLANNQDWEIKPLNLYNVNTINTGTTAIDKAN
jgi:hypothetical protein